MLAHTPRVAVISPQGRVTTVAAGKTRITAVAEGRSGSMELRVVHVPIGRLEVDLAGGDVRVGGLRGAAAYVYDVRGARVGNRTVAWSLSDSTRASIRSTGPTTAEIRGVAPGTLTVTAALGGRSASAPLRVR